MCGFASRDGVFPNCEAFGQSLEGAGHFRLGARDDEGVVGPLDDRNRVVDAPVPVGVQPR